MEEKKNEKEEEFTTISLKKYVWPDEAALKEEKKKTKKLKRALVTGIVFALVIGWCAGSMMPFSFMEAARSAVSAGRTMNASSKIQEVLKVMENDWFFANEIEDVDERLVDQALAGITTNKEDLHTEYMSAEEMESFTQSINRNYVGIGVQFMQVDDDPVVQRVFKGSPAEDAGVMAGDLMQSVDGTSLHGLTTQEIKDLVQGSEGTKLMLTIIRNGETKALSLRRGAVSATAYGEMMENNIAYLQLYQFGESSFEEVKAYLDDFRDAGASKLILDLRDNGGGYLDSVSGVSSCFLKKGSVVLRREYANGQKTEITTDEKQYSDIGPIVILVNENTASAAEVLTLALREQRSDVRVVGTTTYGKGTVQVSRQFSDGSALKYTTSKWLSKDGVWVNGEGITPDEEVKLHEVFYHAFHAFEEDATYTYDSVADVVEDAQLVLSALGYETDRIDGYFSHVTEESLKAFQKDHQLNENGILNQETYRTLRSTLILDWSANPAQDTQKSRAEEILNG